MYEYKLCSRLKIEEKRIAVKYLTAIIRENPCPDSEFSQSIQGRFVQFVLGFPYYWAEAFSIWILYQLGYDELLLTEKHALNGNFFIHGCIAFQDRARTRYVFFHYINESYRGSGHGKALLKELILKTIKQSKVKIIKYGNGGSNIARRIYFTVTQDDAIYEEKPNLLFSEDNFTIYIPR